MVFFDYLNYHTIEYNTIFKHLKVKWCNLYGTCQKKKLLALKLIHCVLSITKLKSEQFSVYPIVVRWPKYQYLFELGNYFPATFRIVKSDLVVK